jgi:hypothetical protein
MVASAQHLGSDSWFDIAWDTSGNCTTIAVGEVSMIGPKGP